ncbi:MAG TPA: VCBS repeat-containing protein, partial [Polyangia bacterium]|nr:VCBS repeat-containing protein [Polyangia bacterium]
AGGGAAGSRGGAGGSGRGGGAGNAASGGGPGGGAGGLGGAGRCQAVRLGPMRSTNNAIIADVDGDDRPDVVTAEVNGQTAVFRQVAPRAFADPDVYVMGTLYEKAIVATDLNEDGSVDFAASDQYGSVGLLLSNTAGARTFSMVNGSVQAGLDDIVTADFDGDGHLDIAIPPYDRGTLAMLWSTGPGTFLPWTEQAICREPTSLAVLDANEDGRPDLLVGCYDGPAQLLLGTNERKFTSTPGFFNILSTEAVAAADVNGDGHADLVIPDHTRKQLAIMLGDGTGQFSEPTGLIASTQTGPVSVAVADFDADGHPDVMVGRVDDPHMFFYQGNGDGHFQAARSLPIDWTAINLAAGDIDGDGVADLLVTNWARGATIYFGPCP